MNKNEEYKKKYLNALEWARKVTNGEVLFSCKEVEEEIFPELAESEDERISKGLIKAVSGTMKGTTLFGSDVTREEALAWLEKQGEQNLANSAKTCKNDSSLAEFEKLGIQPIQLYETALKTYGFASQKWVLIEECGELIDAFAKAERGRAETEHLLEELADVSIMVGQMALAIGFEGFQEKRAEKLLRLKKRLEDKTKQNDKEE